MPSSPRYCCVCQNYGGKVVQKNKVSIHRFPSDLKRRKIWIQRCRNARPNFVFINYDQSRLCGVHFFGRSGPTPENPLPCIFPTASGGEKIYKLSKMVDLTNIPNTNKNSVATDPEVHDLNTVSVDVEMECEKEIVLENRSPDLSLESETIGLHIGTDVSLLDISLKFHDYSNCKPKPSRIRHQSEQTTPDMVSVGTQTDEHRMPNSTNSNPNSTYTQTPTCTSTASVGTQVKRPSLTIEDIAESDGKVLFYTGVPNATNFKCLFNELKGGMKECTTGRPKSLQLIDEFFMVLMRLRLGLLVEDLAERWLISVGACSSILNRWIDYLDMSLCFLVKWPSKKNIMDTMPNQFLKKYPKCRVILDCTEIRTETPCSLQLKSLMYSDYKSNMTWKSLIGISPAGIVTFVSDLYPGSISDKQITIKSGLVDLCEKGDAIMVDKGFLISDITTPKGVELIIPPFKSKKKQFLPHEVERTKSIANLRIHVEREMERIKNYRILQGTMPITMASQASKIWRICVSLTNLLPPLVPK